MNRTLVLYATKEGHTRRIAEHVGQSLQKHGALASVVNVKDSADTLDLGDYDAAILLASVHAGHHEKEMVGFVKQNRARLEGMRAAFLSVSLSEAGAEDTRRTEDEREASAADVQSLVDTFSHETGWAPDYVQPVAGALPYTHYNPFIRFVMKRISKKSGGPTDTSRDYEFTDWDRLNRFVEGFASTKHVA